jgi:hypothetical protein
MSLPPIEPIANPEYDVCLWPVDPACLTEEWAALDPATQYRSLALASATLRRLTAYRVGGCPVTARPCKRSCAADYGRFSYGVEFGWSWTPFVNLEGNWVNACGCTLDCSCGPLCSIDLPGPVTEIVSVDIGGVDYTSQVKVLSNSLIFVGTGDCPFPTCQDLSAAPGQPNTFTVTYHNTYRPDGLGAYAAGVLAMEFAKSCTGKKCRLPRGTTAVVRQGVSIEVAAGSFPDGLTGIEEVDAFIGLWRPADAPTRPSRIWSPGTKFPRIER